MKSALLMASAALLGTSVSIQAAHASAEGPIAQHEGLKLNLRVDYISTDVDYRNPGTPEQHIEGFYVGPEVEYIFPIGKRVGLGAVADIVWGQAEDTLDDGNMIDEWGEVKWVGSVRAKAIFALNETVAVELTAGKVWALANQGESCGDGFTFGFCSVNRVPRTAPFYLETEHVIQGYTWGGGIHIKIADSWGLGLEGRVHDFDEKGFVLAPDYSGNALPTIFAKMDSVVVGGRLTHDF